MTDFLTDMNVKQNFLIKDDSINKENASLNLNEGSVSPNSTSSLSALSSSPELSNGTNGSQSQNDKNKNEFMTDKLVIENSKCLVKTNQVLKMDSIVDSKSPVAIFNSSSQASLVDKFNVEDFIKEQLQQNFKDRMFMLNVERCIIEFIKNEKAETYSFAPMNPYFRMFVHRISEYFGLGHNVDRAKHQTCVIVNKTEKTKLPTSSFQAIIKAADLANITDQSTLASPNSPSSSSPALITTDSSCQEPNQEVQIKKKQILKREVNIQDIQNSRKLIEPMKTKTFEEKSADYIRIKNRIFNNIDENSFDNSANQNSVPLLSLPTNNTTRPQFTILNHQNGNKFSNETLKSTNKTFKQAKQNNSFARNNQNVVNDRSDISLISSSSKTFVSNNSENFGMNFQNLPHQVFPMQQTENFHNNQQSFKMNNENNVNLNLPLQAVHEQYPLNTAMFSNQQQMKYQPTITSNTKSLSPKQQNNYLPNQPPHYNQNHQNTMNNMPSNSHMSHSIINQQYHYQQIPPPPHNQPPLQHPQSLTMSLHSMPSTPYFVMNNQNQNNPQQNIGYYQPSYSREQLNMIDPNNSQYFQKQLNQQYSSQSQMFLNPMQYHQVQNLNPYHPTMTQSPEYANSKNGPSASVISNQQHQNLSLSSSSSSLQQQITSAQPVIHQQNQKFSCIENSIRLPSSQINLDDGKQCAYIKKHSNPNNMPYYNFKNSNVTNTNYNNNHYDPGQFIPNNKNSKFDPGELNQQNNNGFKQSASFNSLPMFNYNNHYGIHPSNINNDGMNKPVYQNYYDPKSPSPGSLNYQNRKQKTGFSNNNQYSRTYNINQSISSSNLNKQNIQNSNSYKSKNYKPVLNRQDFNPNQFKFEKKTMDNNNSNEPNKDSSSASDSSICFQVYNLKENLTKKMLNDLLKPYVVSIDFKPTLNASTTSNEITSNESNDSSSLIINEENENVFIKFENVDKLREAFKSFNLNEIDILKNGSTSNEKSINVNNNGDSSSETQLEGHENKSPFLLKQIC